MSASTDDSNGPLISGQRPWRVSAPAHPVQRRHIRPTGGRTPGGLFSDIPNPAPDVHAINHVIKLNRSLTLVGLVATGVCSMIGGAINIIPFTIQRSVPGIGPNVVAAFLTGAVPAVLAGLAFAILASAMPNAGGTYVYASRALNPYLGFIASFSQWLAICVAMGVVSYILVPFLRDVATAVGWAGAAATLENGPVRVLISLGVLWAAAFVNIRGIETYQRTVVPLMFLT